MTKGVPLLITDEDDTKLITTPKYVSAPRCRTAPPQ